MWDHNHIEKGCQGNVFDSETGWVVGPVQQRMDNPYDSGSQGAWTIFFD